MDDTLHQDLDEGFAVLGPAAERACHAVVLQMATDPAVQARVDARHACMARAYVEEHPDASLERARQTGRRAYLIALLIEAGRSTDRVLTGETERE